MRPLAERSRVLRPSTSFVAKVVAKHGWSVDNDTSDRAPTRPQIRVQGGPIGVWPQRPPVSLRHFFVSAMPICQRTRSAREVQSLATRPSLLGPRYPALARSLPIDDRASGAALTPYCQLGRPVRARRWVEAGAIFTASVPMIEAGFPVLPATPGKAREGKPNSQRSGTCRCAHRGNFLLLAEFGLIFALALAQMACRLIDLAAS